MLQKLPIEIIHMILDQVTRLDPKAVWFLCLVGNRALYRLALPLSWRDVHFTVKYERHDPGVLARHFSEFVSREERVLALRCLRFTFVGYDNHSRTYKALRNHLPRLAKVTDAHVSFVNLRPPESGHIDGSGDQALHTVQLIGGCLPSLFSLHVQGCIDRFSDPWIDLPLSDTLCHIDARYCSAEVAELWLHAPNLQVLEVQGGTPGSFWDVSGEYSCIAGAQDTGTGVYAFLCDDSHPLSKLVRLHLSHDMYDPRQLFAHNECELVVCVFEHRRDPLPRLQELVLDLEFEAEEFQIIWTALKKCAPNLRRLKLTVGADWSRYKPRHPVDLFQGDYPASGEFLNLEELWLPLDGLLQQELVMSELRRSTPRLTAMFLLTPTEPPADWGTIMLSIADKFAAELLALKTISWYDSGIVRIDRGTTFRSSSISMEKYSAPWWADGFRGVGQWWEV